MWMNTSSHNVQVVFDNAVSSNIRPTINLGIDDGLSAWNTSAANVSFTKNTTSDNLIVVIDDPNNPHWAWHDPSYSGVTGTGPIMSKFLVVLNVNHLSTTRTHIAHALIHELGHAIGLADNPYAAPGTQSIMNQHEINPPGTMSAPTSYDVESVNILR